MHSNASFPLYLHWHLARHAKTILNFGIYGDKVVKSFGILCLAHNKSWNIQTFPRSCMHICKKTKNTQSEVILTVWEQLHYCTLCKSSSMKYKMVWPQYIRSRCGKALETPFTLFYPRFSGNIFTGCFFWGSLYLLAINLFKSRKTLQGVRWCNIHV